MKGIANGIVRRSPQEEHDPRPAVVRSVYGPIEAMQAAMTADVVRNLGADYEAALCRDLPTLNLLMRTYGRQPVADLLLNLVTETVLALGEETHCDAEDRENIARGLCCNNNFRQLSMASVIQFFYRMMSGMLEWDGWLRPAQMMRLANSFAKTALGYERRRYIDREQELETLRLDRNVTEEQFEAWKRLHGITWSLEKYKPALSADNHRQNFNTSNNHLNNNQNGKKS